jgi:hypothetical protein
MVHKDGGMHLTQFKTIIYAIANFSTCFQMLTPIITILHVYHYIVNLFPNGWILVSNRNTHQFNAFTCIVPI